MKKNKNYMLFVSIGIVNAITLFLANILFPTEIVLGNSTWSPILSAIITGILLSAVMGLPEPLMKTLNVKIKNEMHLALVYLVFNVVGLWVLARFANYFGFGVTSFVVVLVLGFVLNLVQFFVWKKTTGTSKNK